MAKTERDRTRLPQTRPARQNVQGHGQPRAGMIVAKGWSPKKGMR